VLTGVVGLTSAQLRSVARSSFIPPMCGVTSGPDLRGTNWAGLSLSPFDLTKASLSWAHFAGVNLTSANFTDSQLESVSFVNMNLSSANLTCSWLYAASFSGANLTGANLTSADLRTATGMATANLTNVVWSNTTCPDATNSNNDGNTCVGHL
jgi:uncharacterized protein YjbI with pentapeptide repeats